MELTGKCKEAFDKFLLKWIKNNVAWKSETITQEDVDHFYSFPFSMQFGVYVDFFDSVGLGVYIYPDGDWIYKIENINDDDFFIYSKRVYTRQEAQTEAIIKANEIFNNNF